MWKCKKTLYICFIDYANAFDTVKHDMLFEILLKAGVPDKEINIITSLYLQQKATVRYENETSEEITINLDKVVYCHRVCSTYTRNIR